MSIIYVNPMEKSDVDRVAVIEELSYGNHHWSKDSFYSEINNKVAKYYTARNENSIITGYIGLWHLVDEAHITTIAVHPDYRRQHVADALIVKSLEDCYNSFIKYITLEVRVSNVPAIKLYEKYGFKSLGTRKGYYQDNNEDALIMWTENIFSDEYKELFKKNIDKLGGEMTIQ